MTTWIPSVATTWMSDRAAKYAEKGVGLGPVFTRNAQRALLAETAGALYWAAANGLGVASRTAFEQYMTDACGWTKENIAKMAGQIETVSAEQAKMTPPVASKHPPDPDLVATPEKAEAAKSYPRTSTPEEDQATLAPAYGVKGEVHALGDAWQAAKLRARVPQSVPSSADAQQIPVLSEAWRTAEFRAAVVVGPPPDNREEPASAVITDKPSAEARTVPLFPGEEPLSILAEGLQEKGRNVSLIVIAGWSVTKRDVARAWLKEGGEPHHMPDFLTSCAACDRGEPYVAGREYLHTGQGTLCKGVEPAVAIVRPGIPCTDCEGSGYDVKGDEPRAPCTVCGGDGKMRGTCASCLGAGCDESSGEDCITCGGTGKIVLEASAPVPVPPVLVPGVEQPRRRGRPPGSKNKGLSKAWQAAKERAAATVTAG